ncbi:MAG: glycoside hydrolase family 88 protein [Candidatus Pedobacter colombiensis]|uniref:Glycoside hydrolase family 88 protein n=1 Tax=Candidatus Pedobacter colombiensis TaxID=3121371 RepID=A0AAJ5W6X4_9SPHI|nr:glycoside hydrolase family 88 protein [Pedobacter sp.]WEK17667.1 MAG: glycoside hydrolase family 88 protein [Pedobacter sp.]
MKMRSLIFSLFALVAIAPQANAQNAKTKAKPLSDQMAATVMEVWKDRSKKWSYDDGVVQDGMTEIWRRTGNAVYFKYVQEKMDEFISPEGVIDTYSQDHFNIDNVKNGTVLLNLYKVTGQQKYFKAATTLWEQLQKQPRTKEGGFWHKQIYPNQMWLDGLYMGEPFYAEYAALINHKAAFDDIANQFIFMEKNARDAKTGLLYHGWDESREERWADPKTGLSPHIWARAMGWYGMALVDALDYFPKDHPKRKELINILNRLATAIKSVQNNKTGVWYDILDRPNDKGNYFESSASAMFVYTIAKGVRMEYLPQSYFAVADKGYKGMQQEFVEPRAFNMVNLKGTVTVSGLGGKPYRDGSYAYYLSEKVITNDPKGVGAFLKAINEMEIAAMPKPGLGKTVVLDSYFNNETKKDQSGNEVSWHYKWEEMANGGFSMWGEQFNNAGFKTSTLYSAPTAANLKNASVYIIVDPDTEKETAKPNFIGANDIKNITDWVKAGGILIMMANDTGNVELEHFNHLAKNFGIQFNLDSKGRVVKNQFEMGKVSVPAGNEIFKTAKELYIKEYSSLKVMPPAKSILKDKDGDHVMAIAKLGKGTVFAIGDPWLYNEYVDGRKLPAEYNNFEAGQDLINWIGKQLVKK